MRVIKWIGLIGGLFGLLLVPPVAARLWALEPLHSSDVVGLWVLAGAMILLGLLVAFGRFAGRMQFAALLMPLYGFLLVEMGARTWVRFADTETQLEVMRLGRQSYEEMMAFKPHPFLLHVGRPAVAMVGNEAMGNLSPFNELGFLGALRPYEKPRNTIRVVCMGGSTTARGYPFLLGSKLDEGLGKRWRAQALNFGMGYYSSAHSVVNFCLNALDFDPDYVIFHQAWNDARVRNRDAPTRGDYTHAFKAFEHPVIPDRYLIRGSVVYRYLKERFFGQADWAYLAPAITRDTPFKKGEKFTDLTELEPYARNVRTILDVALARGVMPVLTTQPHTSDPDVERANISVHIQQCNDIVREIAAEYGERILFVDLDRMVTGVHDDFFVDLGHMNQEGKAFKAEAFAKVILEHFEAHGAPKPTGQKGK